MTAALAVRGISKRFGNTLALQSVGLQVAGGSVHALLGHNGSGKSTMIKVLAGYHQADSGSISLWGEDMPTHHNPRDAFHAGLRFVHQDLGLVPTLTVAENLALGSTFLVNRAGGIRWRKQYAHAHEVLSRLGMDLDPRVQVDVLGPVEQTMLAVARALEGLELERSVLLLDEPTARLPRNEVDRLLDVVTQLKQRGVSVVYVTHRLDEVFLSADSVTILRDGQVVHHGKVADTDESEVSRLIIGNPARASRSTPPSRTGTTSTSDLPVLEVDDLHGHRVRGVSLRVLPGEILAVTGLVGSGRSELGRLVYGLQPVTQGSVTLRLGTDRTLTGTIVPREAAAQGVGYSPQERSDGLVPGLSVADNLAVTSYDGLGGHIGISDRRLRAMAGQVVEELEVRPRSTDAIVDELSGGNQQKVGLGKWIRRPLKLLILDEPLQGIDVGAKEDIMHTIQQRAASDGLAVLWLESDVREVEKYATRTIVMRAGRIRTELPGHATEDELLAAVYGAAYAESPSEGGAARGRHEHRRTS